MPRIRAATIAEHKVVTRAMILAQAEEQFGTWGYEETSLGDIAAAVGVGRTTLYDYFRSKDDLLASLVEERLPETIEKLVARLPEQAGSVERLEWLVTLTLEFLVTEPTLGRLLHRDVPKLSETARGRVASAHGSLVREFVDTYQAGVDEGTLKRLPPGLAGRFLNDMIMFAASALIEAEDPLESFSEVSRAAQDLLFNGLATERASSIAEPGAGPSADDRLVRR